MIFTKEELMYFKGADLEYPKSPKKPYAPLTGSSEAHFKYATELKSYEEAEKIYKEERAEYYKVMGQRNEEMLERVRAEYPELTDKQFDIAYHKAYEDGHSSGIESVLSELEDIVDFYQQMEAAKEENVPRRGR